MKGNAEEVFAAFGKGEASRNKEGVLNKRQAFDWDRVGEWCVKSEYMLTKYKMQGGVNSIAKFGRDLNFAGLLSGERKVNGTTAQYRVGLRILRTPTPPLLP